MASLRGISKRVNLLQRRVYPTFGHRFGDDKDETKPVSSPTPSTMINKSSPHIGTDRLGSVFLERQYNSFVRPVGFGLSSCRYMSSTPAEWSDKVDGIDFVATEVVPDEIFESVTSQVAPVINEVAIAAADSAFPVAALQHLIDAVHSFTGLNWWASIALTTVIIRGLTVPILLNQLKATHKLNILRPQLEQLRQEMSTKGSDPQAMAEGQQRMQLLFKQHGVNPFTPLKGLILQGPIFISFFFAIRNMAEKVPSFKTGGTLWFIDLATADTTYILPLLTALTFWITVESNMQEGLEGNPVAGTMKKFSRIIAILSVPVLVGIEKALFCYWLTSNLFSLVYGLAIRRPDIRKLLNLPDVNISSSTGPSSSSSVMPFSFQPLKTASVDQENHPMSSSELSSSVSSRRISRRSILNQRIRTLERQLKEKKNKN